jgi:2-polyprenyl-3-methyl-5-hydroxy-6-metoxy-1,4-benzoquinol methylase
MNEKFYSSRYQAGDGYGHATYNLDNFFRIHAVKRWLRRQHDIFLLDAGCGGGTFCRQVYERLGGADRIRRVAGVDLVNEIKDQPAPDFHFSACNLNEEALPFKDDSFNLIFCNHVVEHLFNTEHLFSELYRVTKPGGLAVVSTPNLSWWINRILLVLGIQPVGTEVGTESITYGMGILSKRVEQFRPAGHIRCFTPAALRDMGERAGFRLTGWWRQDFHNLQCQPALMRNIGIILHRD